MKRSILIIICFIMFLPAAGRLNAYHGQHDIEELVDELTRNIISASDYNNVKHLFWNMEDFNSLVEILKKSPGLSKTRKKQLEGESNLKKQRNEMRRQINEYLIKRWNRITDQIKRKHLSIQYRAFKQRKKVHETVLQNI